MRIVGVILLSLLPFASGIIYNKQLKQRADILKRFEKFILFVKDEIRYSSRELDEIFSLALRRPMFAICFFEELFRYYKNGEDFSKIENTVIDIRLKSHELEMIYEFFSRLGTNDSSGQLAYCEYYYNHFSQFAFDAEKAGKNKGRLMLSVSGIASAGMFILLI